MQAMKWLELFERLLPAVVAVYVGIEKAKKDDGEVSFLEGIQIFKDFMKALREGNDSVQLVTSPE